MDDGRRTWPLLGDGGPCPMPPEVRRLTVGNPFGMPFKLWAITCSLGLETDRQADLGVNILRTRDGETDWVTFFRRDAYRNPAGQADMQVYRAFNRPWIIGTDEAILVEYFVTPVGQWGSQPVAFGMDVFADGEVMR